LYLQGDESKVQNHWVKFDVGSGVSIFGVLDVDREFCQQEEEKGVMIKHSRSRVWNRTQSLTFWVYKWSQCHSLFFTFQPFTVLQTNSQNSFACH
jgi:hypothetical protein